MTVTKGKGIVKVAFVTNERSYQVDDEIENPDKQWVDAGWIEMAKVTKRAPKRKAKKDG